MPGKSFWTLLFLNSPDPLPVRDLPPPSRASSQGVLHSGLNSHPRDNLSTTTLSCTAGFQNGLTSPGTLPLCPHPTTTSPAGPSATPEGLPLRLLCVPSLLQLRKLMLVGSQRAHLHQPSECCSSACRSCCGRQCQRCGAGFEAMGTRELGLPLPPAAGLQVTWLGAAE